MQLCGATKKCKQVIADEMILSSLYTRRGEFRVTETRCSEHYTRSGKGSEAGRMDDQAGAQRNQARASAVFNLQVGGRASRPALIL